MAGNETALDIAQHLARLDKAGRQLSHRIDTEIHQRAVEFGLVENLHAVGVHRHGEIISLTSLLKTADMVDMRMCEEDAHRLQALLGNEIGQFLILGQFLGAGVDNGALLGVLVPEEIAIDLKMVEYKLLYFHRKYLIIK